MIGRLFIMLQRKATVLLCSHWLFTYVSRLMLFKSLEAAYPSSTSLFILNSSFFWSVLINPRITWWIFPITFCPVFSLWCKINKDASLYRVPSPLSQSNGLKDDFAMKGLFRDLSSRNILKTPGRHYCPKILLLIPQKNTYLYIELRFVIYN